MIIIWDSDIEENFGPGWVNCLDESMSPWTNKYICPGHMLVPCKPRSLGNEYHSRCCCESEIMWAVELVEGKDRPPEKKRQKKV